MSYHSSAVRESRMPDTDNIDENNNILPELEDVLCRISEHENFYNYMAYVLTRIDLKSVWIGKTNSKWHVTTMDDIKKKLGLENIAHTHNALEDAKEQSTKAVHT
jgi:hypothetical protein